MKFGLVVARVLMVFALCGVTGCLFHSRSPLSRVDSDRGPIQLDSPRDRLARRPAAAREPPPASIGDGSAGRIAPDRPRPFDDGAHPGLPRERR